MTGWATTFSPTQRNWTPNTHSTARPAGTNSRLRRCRAGVAPQPAYRDRPVRHPHPGPVGRRPASRPLPVGHLDGPTAGQRHLLDDVTPWATTHPEQHFRTDGDAINWRTTTYGSDVGIVLRPRRPSPGRSPPHHGSRRRPRRAIELTGAELIDDGRRDIHVGGLNLTCASNGSPIPPPCRPPSPATWQWGCRRRPVPFICAPTNSMVTRCGPVPCSSPRPTPDSDIQPPPIRLDAPPRG